MACSLEGESAMALSVTLNGRTATLDVSGDTPLLWAIREQAGLTGTKFGCGIAQCGACTVHLDGKPIRSCVTPMSAVAGKHVTTIEGVSGSVAAAVQSAWEKLDVPQCGYCQSGQIMSAIALLNEKRSPTDPEIDAAMSGNICRCGTYVRIRAAIHEAAEMRKR
jgi:isoquinoline 1-oxidoreductase subunit alpha